MMNSAAIAATPVLMPQRMENICPICESSNLRPTAETFDLAEIFHRWEREAKIIFTESVWQTYTQPSSPRVTLHRCASCGFAMFDPALAGSPDFYACITTSDGTCYTPDKWEFVQAIKDLKKHRCKRVLDVGSGSGYFLDLLRQHLPQAEAAGFEFNSEMAQLLRDKGHKVYEGNSLGMIQDEGGSELFDAICIFQVLEHVVDPVALITSARQLLRAEGLLIVAVPDNAGPVRHFSTALTELPPHHLSRWRASTFSMGLPRLGFEILRIAYEPLPSFLWKEYLPVILDHSKLPKFITDGLKKNDRLVRVLNRLRLRWLYGIRGHSVYVVSRKVGPE